MFRTLNLELTNGMVGDKREAIYVNLSEGLNYFTAHVAYETNGWSDDITSDGFTNEARMYDSKPDMWFHIVRDHIDTILMTREGTCNYTHINTVKQEWMNSISLDDFTDDKWNERTF